MQGRLEGRVVADEEMKSKTKINQSSVFPSKITRSKATIPNNPNLEDHIIKSAYMHLIY